MASTGHETTWTCKQCGASVGDTADVCWRCATPRSAAGRTVSRVRCMQCDRDLEYVGTKSFHEGTRWGVLGDIGELFVNKQKLDLYCCPRCGRVEFFVDGIGEDLRRT